MKDYYCVLGIDKDAGQQEIKRAFRDLVKRFHPDTGNKAEDSQRFREVAEAYETLSDDGKRFAYDKSLSGPGMRKTATPKEPVRPTQPSYAGNYRSNPYIRDITDDSVNLHATSFRDARRVLTCVISLTASESERDVAWPFKIRRTRPCPICGDLPAEIPAFCPHCGNSRIVDEDKVLVVNIPAGTPDGTVTRLTLDHVGMPDVVLSVEIEVS